MKPRFLCLVLALAFCSHLYSQSLPVVPRPTKVVVHSGHCEVPGNIRLAAPFLAESVDPDDMERFGLPLVAVDEILQRFSNGKHKFTFESRPSNSFLTVAKSDAVTDEEYRIQIKQDSILIGAATNKGLAHALATFIQLLAAFPDGKLPVLDISDRPDVPYRSLMIDMGRNPHSIGLLKEVVDLAWFYKVDSIQIHLTDDQRFAFPSEAFHKLWDGKITADQFRDLQRYAANRGVTIIPELEVPGHSGILRRVYPEVFGKTPTELATSKKALAGIETLLDEMIDVFPQSPYVHIGGDEAYGVPEEDQRELINKLHRYLESKGKQTLVWEGPRRGTGSNKVHADVIHLNWRTINFPANQMLSDGHRVVNASWDPLYIVDHYPRTNFTMASPKHIYESLKLTRFKHFNPGIPTFAKPVEVDRSDRLIGFCMPWWEGREENFMPQVVPRLIAFSERSWNGSAKIDFSEFEERMRQSETTRLGAFYPVDIAADNLVIEDDGVFHNETVINLNRRRGSAEQTEVRFTLDGSQPETSSSLYQSPFTISESTQIRAALFRNGKQVGHGSRRNLTAVIPAANLALGKPVSSSVTSSTPFSVERLTDGGTENLEFYLAYPAQPKPVEIVIDLEEVHDISRIVVFAYSIANSFEKYSVETSADGVEFKEIATRLEKPVKNSNKVTHRFQSHQAKYVRIKSHGNFGYVFDSFSKLIEVQVFKN